MATSDYVYTASSSYTKWANPAYQIAKPHWSCDPELSCMYVYSYRTPKLFCLDCIIQKPEAVIEKAVVLPIIV